MTRNPGAATTHASNGKATAGRLFVLEANAGRIHSMATDGSDRKVVVSDCRLPDGIVIDVEGGHIYWTNMGSSPSVDDGSIERADLDGSNRRVIVPRASPSRRSRSISIGGTASSTGATAKACS